MKDLDPSYDTWTVIASVLIAMPASYVAVDLTQRIRANQARMARRWWAGGSIAMGTGVWSMHFIGMLAFTVPITIGYTGLLTFLSWLADVSTSAIALGVTARHRLSAWWLILAALAMGGGICVMHYTGMAAANFAGGRGVPQRRPARQLPAWPAGDVCFGLPAADPAHLRA